MNKKTMPGQQNRGLRTTKRSQPSALIPHPSKLIPRSSNAGFTLIELIMIITIIGILGISVAVKWPTGLDDEAAIKEFIHAFRYAQHQAITREYDITANIPWGIRILSDRYTIQRNGTDCSTCPVDPGCASAEYCNRNLLDDPNINLGPDGDIYFNGLGEPINNAGTPLPAQSLSINGINLTVCPETGYIQREVSCP